MATESNADAQATARTRTCALLQAPAYRACPQPVEELSTWLATTLPTRAGAGAGAGAGASAAEVADTLVSLLQDIDAALAPIIGQPSVTLIYQRSLVLNAPAHPWVAGVHESADVSPR